MDKIEKLIEELIDKWIKTNWLNDLSHPQVYIMAKGIEDIIKSALSAEQERRVKEKECYETIFSEFIPTDKLDEANNKLIELLKGNAEKIGRVLLKHEQ